MIYVRCSHCGKRIRRGEKCTCGFKREYTVPEGTRKLYHTSRWTALQHAIMARYSGMDLYAMQTTGITEAASVVHHIVPAEESPELFWNPDNLIPLSRFSHDEVHRRYRESAESREQCQKLLRSLVRSLDDSLI